MSTPFRPVHTVAVIAIAAGLIGLSVPAAADAASATGSISGKVVGFAPAGSGGAGVSVNAKNADGDVFSTRADSAGRFRITGMKPGRYAIKFTDTKGHIYCDGGCSRPIHNATEWLGDQTSFATSDTVVVKAGKTTSGIREVMAETGFISGALTVDGARPAKYDVSLYIRSLDGKRYHHVVLSTGSTFEFAVRKDNYTIKVKSKSGAFAPFFLTDPTDGNTVFHVNGVGKQTGVRFDVKSS